jgi:hypothetical protein
MKGSPISPRPAAKAAHPHPAGAGAIRPRRDAVQSLPSNLLAGLLREAITKRQSGVGRTFYSLSADCIVRFSLGLSMTVSIFYPSYSSVIHLKTQFVLVFYILPNELYRMQSVNPRSV